MTVTLEKFFPPAVIKGANVELSSLILGTKVRTFDRGRKKIQISDPRIEDWFLMTSPLPGLTVLILYLFFVNKWGPRYMEKRKPWELKSVLIVYNFLQVLLSLFIFTEGIRLWVEYDWRCEPVDRSNTPKAVWIARLCHTYFLAKMSELLDTVFFVLRKKNNQVSFLHVYHHTVMPMSSWLCTKYFPGGHATFIGLINSLVHVIMYTYYMLAAVGPEMQKYLWWKKYITNIQLIQFCLTFIHGGQLLFYDCGYPRWTVIFMLPNSVFFFYLFFNFHRKTYTPNNGVQNNDMHKIKVQ